SCGPQPLNDRKMTDCCIPQQNPALYQFTHRVIHKPHDRFYDPLVISASFNRKRRGQNRKLKIRERCANVFVTMPPQNKDAP
ncbi:hypothetical protein, partial [Citrobacter portucalensis]|uniref:hypothetical protein n=2 Tax=Citrobacter TaxID=544 RepID=UPI00292AEAE4